MTVAERIAVAERQGDYRTRCDRCAGLVCQACHVCTTRACDPEGVGDWKGKIRTDKLGRTLCRECRYDRDELGL